ncbi:hypothetical protein ACXJJ3_32690 [Kribbella sp. WER1]
MRIIRHSTSGGFREVSGPGDIAGKVYDPREYDALHITGTPSVEWVGRWATPLGVFAAMGGTIDWRNDD